MVIAGTWQAFLIHDAEINRKSFAAWWAEIFCKSQDFSSFPKPAKRQISELLKSDPLILENVALLLPETLEAFRAWQSIPLDPASSSAETSKAYVRLHARNLASGQMQLYENGRISTQEIPGDVRLWIYKKHDGTFAKHESLLQPLGYKELDFDTAVGGLNLRTRIHHPPRLPTPPTKFDVIDFDLETLRISKVTFSALLGGSWRPIAFQSPEGSKENPVEISDSDSDEDGSVLSGREPVWEEEIFES